MQVLEGLDPVRKRPGMYIGSTGPTGLHHCVWEVVDNSVDEAMAGFCTRIDITLLADGGCRVVDNGRGIPTDLHPVHKISGVEVVFDRWGEVVGDAMAARTQPVRIDGDTLVVRCDEPAIATHIRYLQVELIERLAQLSGERRINRIELRVAGARRGPRPPRRNPRTS